MPSSLVSTKGTYEEVVAKYRTFKPQTNAHLAHTVENYEMVMAEVTTELGGAKEASSTTRAMLMGALDGNKRRGGRMLGGSRANTPEVRQGALGMLLFFKGTIRDVITDKPDVFSEFLRDIRGGLKKMCGYPKHEVLTKFLGNYLSQDDIFGEKSPFNETRWKHVVHDNARNLIVCETLRTVL